MKEEDYPQLEEHVEVQGAKYKLTHQQLKLLDEVIPSDYDKMSFGGLKFKRYDEYGLDISQKHKYEKYIASDQVAVVDTFEVETMPPQLQVDNDLNPGQINANS